MSTVLAHYRQAMKPAADTIEKLYKNTIADKSEIIKLQDAVIRQNSEQIKELSSTVQTEMKSYCDIVKKSCKKSAVSPEKLKSVVKSVAEEEDRKSNLIVFGLTEDTNEDLADVVSEVLETVDVKPKVIECSRMGGRKEEHCRPVKVKLSSQDSVNAVLRNSRKLKGVGKFEAVFLAPDRSIEERTIHRKLVEELKSKIQTEPSKYHYIRDQKIFSVDKA